MPDPRAEVPELADMHHPDAKSCWFCADPTLRCADYRKRLLNRRRAAVESSATNALIPAPLASPESPS